MIGLMYLLIYQQEQQLKLPETRCLADPIRAGDMALLITVRVTTTMLLSYSSAGQEAVLGQLSMAFSLCMWSCQQHSPRMLWEARYQLFADQK
jgi:hypothetical protein